MRISTLCVSMVLSVLPVHGAPPAAPYVADPDEDRPTLHVQPPALDPALASRPTESVETIINGIFVTDVLAAAGFDIGGADFGNEPALTANPLDPNQIVLTSFSGSDWASGGNSTLFYSGDGGTTWTYSASVPPPPGDPQIGCPCDQTVDWGRDGILYGTFLSFDPSGTTAAVYSAQATVPTTAASWVYRTSGGVAQSTSPPSLLNPDQPWIWSGPLPEDNARVNVCVAYDNFDGAYTFEETRGADSPGAVPLDFTRDAATNVDGQQYNDGMNPGHRIAVGPDGKIWSVFQRLVSVQSGGVKELTYLVSVSTDGGSTWSVANSDHPSGAKIVAANVLSFQGNGSKVGAVNALLGGVDAIAVDPSTGSAWIVYGTRATLTGIDVLNLVPVTYAAGNLTLGTPHVISPTVGARFYMPAVAVLPSGEIGVLFLGAGVNFTWRFVQTTDGGLTLAKATTLATFTSPFSSIPASNQRVFGDYIQLRAVGCSFYGAYPARGTGASSATSIDPYFMKAPAFAPCTLPALSGLVPAAVCAGSADFDLTLQGSGFSNGATARVGGALRSTTFGSPAQLTADVPASDVATPGSIGVDLLGAAPAAGLSASLPLLVEAQAASPGSSLRLSKNVGDVRLDWSASAGATSYNVKRCTFAGACAPATIATPAGSSHQDPVLGDPSTYWYLVESTNSCGAVP